MTTEKLADAVKTVRSGYDWQATDCPEEYRDAMTLILGCAERAAQSEAQPDADLWICARGVKEPRHDGDTGYEYYQPVRPYVEAQPAEDTNTVNLTYFKPSGKYYSSGSFKVYGDKHLSEVCEVVRALMQERGLPDLVSGHSDFDVMVEFQGVPAIIHAATAPKTTDAEREKALEMWRQVSWCGTSFSVSASIDTQFYAELDTSIKTALRAPAAVPSAYQGKYKDMVDNLLFKLNELGSKSVDKKDVYNCLMGDGTALDKYMGDPE